VNWSRDYLLFTYPEVSLPCLQRVCNWNIFNLIHLACPTSFKRIFILSSHSYFFSPNYFLLFIAISLCVETQKCKTFSLSMQWRHTGGGEVWLHSFLTLAQDRGEWLTWSVSCFRSLCVLPNYSMVQSPSWEANWFAASQEIPRISRNSKVHYRTHKRQPAISILGPPNPVHIPTSYLLEIRPNIIHPSKPRSPQWSLSFRFPHQDPIHPPLLTHTRHMTSPPHSSRFYHPQNIGWGVQII